MGQLDEYFTGSRMTFDIPLHLCGTEFQKRVWLSLPYIPYGETRSYKDIAVGIGQPNAVRAVAQAIGANAISILVPCHRVIGCNHTLTGYAGGLDAKNILVLRNAFEKTRKQMKANALSINALSDNLNFPMFAELTLKKT